MLFPIGVFTAIPCLSRLVRYQFRYQYILLKNMS
jgi:hypothetical protein